MYIEVTPLITVLLASGVAWGMFLIYHYYGIYRKQETDNQPNPSEAITAVSSFQTIEQQARENLDKQMDEMMKYMLVAIMIMVPVAIAGVIFLVGTGMVQIG